jgi:hypothetical protein
MKLLMLLSFIYCLKQENKPILMNVTYESPWKDLQEERKFLDEHFKYMNKTKELEKKFTDDMNLLKMMFNIQNNQIYKLREIIEVNKAILSQVEAK